MLKFVTAWLLCSCVLVALSTGRPVESLNDGEIGKVPPSFRKPLAFFEAVGFVDDIILNRHIREAEPVTTEASTTEKDTWTKIQEFYADNNNMAMFLVLPLIILVYGGCSAIYCVAKCRRYMRRKSQKKIREDKIHLNEDDKNDLNQDTNDDDLPNYGSKQTYNNALSSPNFTSSANNINHTDSHNDMSGTPLPSQVPDDENIPPKPNTPVKPVVIDTHNKLDSRMSHKDVDASRRTYRDIFTTKENKIQESENLSFVDKSGMPIKTDATMPLNPPPNSGRESTLSYKEELLAKYDALSTFAMAKKAADILKMSTTVEKDPFSRKARRKVIYIAE